MTTKFKKPIALLLAVAMLMMLNFPSGIFGNIGFGLTANAEDNTQTSTKASTITFTALDGTEGANIAEDYDMLIDGKTSTKWCVTSFSSAYIVFKASEPIYVKGYTITTGDDNSENNGRNPKVWKLQGCNDYNKETKEGTWVDINTVTNDTKLQDTNNTDYDFSFAKTTTAYQYFRLEITAIQSGNIMQMSEFTLSYDTCDHAWAKTDTTIDPTCTEGGYDVYACEKCGTEKKVPNDTPATGHNKGEDGKCTNCGAYMISNADELKAFADAVNGGETSANAVLTADIKVNEDVLKADGTLADDVSGFTSWTPIGWYDGVEYEEHYYTGTFDGAGHTISGLYFDDKNINYVGLFGYVGAGGSVLNVGVVDSYFSGKNSVGGVCGVNSKSTIENCYNTGSVSGSNDVGGVCGYNYNATITSCYNEGTVSSGKNFVGGVCGYNSESTIENCYNTGSVSGSGDSYSVGGVCGYNLVSTIENCYNTGTVSGSNAVGGVCGYDEGTITNCYYLSKTSCSDRKTAAQFKSGEVAYLLSHGGKNGGSVWGQNIGTDDYPVLNGDTVYATTGCVTYNNKGNTDEKEHHYKEGICTDCGAYKEPEKDTSGVYQISKGTDLYWFADTVNSGNNSVNAVLTNDITVNEDVLKADGTLADDVSGFTYWTPIGYYNSDSDRSLYTGTFNGQGHTISGLYFNDTNIAYVGLFGCVGEGGSVLNVGVVDSYFSGSYNVGGVCGVNEGTITSCYNEGTVSGGEGVGGVCGSNYESTIENCYNTGSVSGSNVVGGVCGDNMESTIENCYNTGSVSGGEGVGGVCGYNEGTITNCYYLSKTSCSDRKTAAQFKSGEVAYLLSHGGKNGSSVWGQKIGTDDYPVLNGDTVYATTGCATYNNSGDTHEKEHHYKEGICTDCGGYEAPEKDENGVYQISKVTELYWLADTVNSGNGSIDAVLTNDITVNEDVLKADGTLADDVSGFTYWTPIGYYNSGSDRSLYNGTFNGQGHTISGLYFNDKNINYVGLFGYVGENGSVLNVGVVDSYFSGSYNVGGVCGKNRFSKITNCYSTGAVDGEDCVGGVCGTNFESTIENCYNEGTVSGSSYNVGGVCGYNDGSGKITNCYNEGTVSGSSDSNNVGGVCGYNDGTIENCYNTGSVSGSNAVGGVCGYNDGTFTNCYNTGSVSGGEGVGGVCGENDGTIENCYNEGTVSGSSDNVGGVCGYNDYNGKITNCYNEGTVSGGKFVGGVCGYNYGTIENCYNEGTVSGGKFVGGVCGYNDEGTITNCYNTGSVSGGEGVGGVCGKNDYGKITNCYYLKTDTINKDINAIGNEDSDTEGKAESKTTTDFTDGTICELVKYHSHQNGICSLCGGYEPATLTNDKYDINGDDTPDEVYEISSTGQLYWFAEYVNSGNNSANAVLTADITVNKDVLKADGTLADDVSGFTRWKPIGWCDNEQDAENYYTGTFDGAGHTISGLYFNDKNSYNVGLFGYVEKNGSVSNVGVVDSYFSGKNSVGGVCGYNEDGAITNCYNTGTVSGSEDVGGVCGQNYGGRVTNCYNTGSVSGSSNSVGGVCGQNLSGTITNCYYLAKSETDSIDGTTFKTTDQFAGGEVAYILQSVQTPATEGGTIPQVWGQKLTGETKDALPVLTSNSAKTVYKVIFATQSNSSYAVKYANPSGVYELPTAPSIDNSNNGFYKWSTSQTDYRNAANDFTATTAVAGDITVYAVSGEKYGANDNEKTVTTTYGTEKTQDLSKYAVFASYTPADGETPASGTTSAGKFTYTIESGNDTKLGATINGDTLTIPGTAAAGTYNLTIKATVKTDNVSLMSVDFGTEPLTFEVAVTVNPLAENTPTIAVNYTDETLTGFESDSSYTIGGTAVTPTDGALTVESYIGSEISIVKKASDTNHADSAAQTLTISARPNAPTGISATQASDNDISDGTITNVDDTMEYKAANANEWQSVIGNQITGLAAGSYKVRYKATQAAFASDSAEINIGVVGKFAITFVNYDNSVLQTAYVTEGSMPQYSGETPTKPSDDKYSYTFAGWEPEITAVTENATYMAQFDSKPREYSVTLETNGGTVENADNYKTYSYGTGLILPTPTKENYYFVGWYENENFEGEVAVTVTAEATGDKTYYAKWTEEAPSEYLITFVNYDNSVLQTINLAVGSTPQYSGETPTKPSDDKYTYTFTGWSPEVTAVTENATYAAQFERTPIDYYVEFTDESNAVVLVPEAVTDYVLIFAAYDISGKMTDVELQRISFDVAGEKEFAPETLDTSGAVKIKVMLWSNIGEISPKCSSDEMSLQ